MTRRIYLYFLATIVLGAVLGGAGVYYYLWYMGHLQFHLATTVKVEHLKQTLNLSDAQAQQVTEIYQESDQKIKALDPQYAAIHKETHDRIRALLTPEQAVKFDEHVARINQRHRRNDPSSVR